MSEALFASGGSYEAAELRKLIRSMFYHANGGVIRGMEVTPGVGLNVTIGIGFFIVNDSDLGSFLGYATTAQTVSITGNTSGSTRVDTVYASVDATTGATTYGKTTGGTSVPSGSIALASIAVPNNATGFASANITNNANEVDLGGFANTRFVRKDQVDQLRAGTTVAAPTSGLHVANKSYVDSIALRTPHRGNFWGGSGYHWRVPDGNWNVPPGSALEVQGMVAGHIYVVTFSGVTMESVSSGDYRFGRFVSPGAPPVRAATGYREPAAGATYMGEASGVHVVGSQRDAMSFTQRWLCPASGTYWFYPAFAVNGVCDIHPHFGAPYTEITDVGPMYVQGGGQV